MVIRFIRQMKGEADKNNYILMKAVEYKNHWETVFKEKDTTNVSWYQKKPIESIELIQRYSSIDDKIIDIGGGDSCLPEELLKIGYSKITKLDISRKALELSKIKLGDDSDSISFIESNVMDFETNEEFDVWHDRAVFHFLDNQSNRLLYKKRVLHNLSKLGVAIIAASSKNGGPEKCSGLEIERYDENSFRAFFEPEFKIIESFEKEHITPSGSIQNFCWVIIKKNS